MITYRIGDAANDPTEGLIVHVCNDLGLWGSGFVVPLGNRIPLARRRYRAWALANDRETRERLVWRSEYTLPLGAVQFVPSDFSDRLWVANMIAQRGVGLDDNGRIPLRYDALDECLKQVARFATGGRFGWKIHMPRIGCGLAGGTWDKVGPLVEVQLGALDVTVYDLPR